MKQWMNIGNKHTRWLQNWQRYEDYRGKRIYINTPNLQLLCNAGCEEIKKKIDRALQDYLIDGLKRQPGYEFVASRAEADFEIHIMISRVKEHHYIEYVSIFPPSNFYNIWFKVVNLQTGNTAFWASEFDFFTDADHQRTYGRLISEFNDFQHEHN